jgi:hypothetical protein
VLLTIFIRDTCKYTLNKKRLFVLRMVIGLSFLQSPWYPILHFVINTLSDLDQLSAGQIILDRFFYGLASFFLKI